jgi:hypothetical protein
MTKLLNEYDDTKRMLRALREFKAPSNGKFLTERKHYYGEQDDQFNNEQPQNDNGQPQNDNGQNNVDAINDVDIKMISNDERDMTLSDEQKTMISGLIDSFREQVSQTAELTPGFTFNLDEIRLDGVIPEFDIKFTYITGQNAGLYINAEMLNITQQTMDLLNKLSTYNKQITDSLELMLRQRKNN